MGDRWLLLFVGVVVGAVWSGIHLGLLKLALARADGLGPDAAKKQLVRGMWLRIAMWIPALAGAVWAGLWACLGLVLGSLLGRWLIVWRTGAS